MRNLAIRRMVIALAVVACVVAPHQNSWSSHIWTPRSQVSFTEKGNTCEYLSAGRADSVRAYAAFREYGPELYNNPYWNQCGIGQLVALRFGNNWLDGWALRERFTQFDRANTDHHLVVDRDDRFHFVAESFQHQRDAVPSNSLSIGYKVRDGANWSPTEPPIIVSGQSGDSGSDYPCGGMSPFFFLQERATGDTLHVSFRHNYTPGLCLQHADWLAYRRTPLNSQNPWRTSGISYVTSDFGSAFIIVDQADTVHFLATPTVDLPGGGREFSLTHIAGLPPANDFQEWNAATSAGWHKDIIHTWTDVGCGMPVEDEEISAAFHAPSSREVGGYIYIAFHAIESCERDIYLTRINTSNRAIDTPVRLTPADGQSYGRPNLVITEDGTFHLTLINKNEVGLNSWTPAADNDILHMMNEGDPMNPADWSTPELVTYERRETAQFARYHASQDSVWMVYTCHDDDQEEECDPGHPGLEKDCDFEVWAQERIPIPDSVPLGETMTWSGNVYLDADFVVPATSMLVIAAGTTVYAKANDDDANQGIYGDRVEIIVRGDLVAPGILGSPIVLTSTLESQPGAWGGIRFEGAPSSDLTQTDLSFVSIRSAIRGVQPDTLGFNLMKCSFANSSEADIYTDRDFRLQGGKTWGLEAPTTWKFKNSDAANKPWSVDPTKAEVLVEGTLTTTRPSGVSSTDSVWITTATGTSPSWVGLTFGDLANGNIQDASISYATDPVTFLGSTVAKVWNSRISNYRDQGILDVSSRAWVKGCTLTRHPTLFPTIQRSGIQCQSSGARIENNTIGDHSHYGIKAEFSSGLCGAPVPAETLLVLDNVVTGDGSFNPSNRTGIFLSWGCENRHPRISGNVVKSWGNRGLAILSSAETWVTCNDISENKNVGIYYFRHEPTAGGPVVIYDNDLKKNEKRNLKTDEAYDFMLRDPAPGAPGKNRIQIFEDSNDQVKNLEIVNNSYSIDAQQNHWLNELGNVIADTLTIRGTFTGADSFRVDIRDPLAQSVPDCGGSSAKAGRIEIASMDPVEAESASTSVVFTSDPIREYRLFSPAPNPAHGNAEIKFDIPANLVGPVKVEVFDLRGRLVERLVDSSLSGGRHRLEWPRVGRRESTQAGVYFVRMEAGKYSATKKLVLVN